MPLNQNTELGLLNTTTNAGSITLPLISTTPGRVLSFKDSTGTFGRNGLSVTTSGSDTFEDGGATKVLRETYGSIQLVGSNGKWYILNGTQVNTVQVSSLITNTISSFNISSINTYVSSLSLIDNTLSTNLMNVSTAFASTQNVSTSFLYYNNYVIAGTRIGYSNVLNRNSFSPIYINGLSLWMDAADTSVVRLSGANVVSIADKSASGLTMTATGTVPYVTAAQNGLNAVGNLTNTAYLATSSNNFDFYFNNFAVFAVVRTEPTTGALYPVVSKNFGFGTGAPSSNYWGLYGGNANPPTFSLGVIPANASLNSIASPTTTTSTWIVISSAVYRATNSSVVAINGTAGSAQNTNAGPLNAGPLPIIIGASILGSSPLSFSSLVGEVLIYNASITTFQRQQIEGYLAWKWGLQANLPASHPFFSAPPT